MSQIFSFTTGTATKALALDEYHVWDCSVIKAKGKYHMFSYRMRKPWDFGGCMILKSSTVFQIRSRGRISFRTLCSREEAG